jgi:hypothetical protein
MTFRILAARRWSRFGSSSLLLAALTLPLAGCSGNSDGGRGAPIEFTRAAAKALPAVTPPAPVVAIAPVGPVARSAAPIVALALQNVGTEFYVSQTFRQECRNWGWDFCPPGTPAKPATGSDPYQFGMQSLIGMVAHAQLYTGTLVTSCTGSGLTPITVTSGSYVAGSSAPAANPTRFILGGFSEYTCRDTNLDAPAFQTRVISTVADGSHQSALHTRHAYVAASSSGAARLAT